MASGASAQTLDFGDFSSFGSASSTVNATLKIGATTDVEAAITANTTATGDDITGSDDENGVTLPADIIQGALTTMTVNVTNTSGSSTYLNVWIDYNRNGSLADAGELVLTNSLIANGTSNSNRTVTFTVPLTATTGVAGVRVRLTSTSSPGQTGTIGNGEVEDYVVNIVTSTDFGDYPSFASASQRADSSLIRIGTAATDAEAANPATGTATLDDTTGTDDEDLTMPVFTVGVARTLSVPITATLASLSGTAARAIVFVDWNGDNDVLDTNETLAVQTIATGTNTLSFSLTPPTGTVPGTKYLRIRVAETTATPAFSGASTLRGEVEDYAVTAVSNDFGDFASFGSASSTMLATLKIGAATDAELSATANASATGDDITGADDEDGVTLPAVLYSGTSNSLTVNVTNTSGSSAYLNVWIDYNNNGVLTDSGEQVAANTLIATGTSGANRVINFTVPGGAAIGTVGVRVRLTSTSSPTAIGASGNGEVEDSVVNIDSAITTLSNETLVNTTTAGVQDGYYWSIRTVAVQPDGSFIKVWRDLSGTDGQARGVFGQRFDASGNRLGSEFLVNTSTSGDQDNPTLAVAPDGSFVVGWDGPGTSIDVFGQRFSPTGQKVGEDFLLSTTISGNQKYPELCFFPDGTFVAAFVDNAQSSMQRFDAQARRIGLETNITSVTGDVVLDSMDVLPDSRIILTWTESGDVYGQLFTSSLEPIGTALRLNQYTASMQEYSTARADDQGNIVIVWESDGQDGAGMGVYGRRFDSTLTPLGNEFALTTNTTGGQYEPQLGVAPSGAFVVGWTDYDNNRDGGGGTPTSSVWMRVYDAAGTPLGSEIIANQSTVGYQGFPTMSMNDSGRLVVSWEGSGTQTGQIDDSGVFLRRYQFPQTGTTAISASPASGNAGDLVTVTMTLTAPTNTPNVTPNPLSVSGTNGVSATLVSGPSPASATVGTGGTSFTWTYRLTALNKRGTLTFGGNANDTGETIFPYATSSNVVVSPTLYIRDVTSPNVDGDSNVKTSAGAGPNVFTIGARVTNPSLTDLTDVVVNVGDGTTPGTFPATTMSLGQTNNTYQGTFRLDLLAANSDASRTLFSLGAAKTVIAGGIDFNGNGIVNPSDAGILSNGMKVIAGRVDVNGDNLVNTSDDRPKPPGDFDGYVEPAIIDGYVDVNGDGTITAVDADTFGGETAILYWQVAYETVDASNNATWGNASDIGDDLRYDWTVWGTSNQGGIARTSSYTDSVKVRNEISASANKVSPNPGGFISGGPPRILSGKVDINSDGSITAADDGSYYGKTIIDGSVDINSSATITTADDGTMNGYNVIDGSIDASGNGSIGSEDDIIMVQIGQTFTITVNNGTFGTIGAGYDADRDGKFDYDLWHQPVGETDWNSDAFRLIDIQSAFIGTGGGNPLSGITTHYNNEPYLSRVFDGDLYSGGFNATYTYTYVVMAAGTTNLSPYHQAGSGTNNEKYSGDYGIDVVATTGLTGGTPAITLTKTGGPNPTIVTGTTTWSMTYQNKSSMALGNPSTGNGVVIEDAIPANTTFVANSATSATYPTIIQYSTDGGATWTTAQPAAASVNRLRWLVDQSIPVSGTGSVSFQTTVNSGTASETSIPNQAIVKIGTGPTIATANAAVTAMQIDYGDLSLLSSASSYLKNNLRIGALADFDLVETTNATATGDDLTDTDDEDGVTVAAKLMQNVSTSLTVNVTNTSGASAYLNVWIDFNRNGALTDAGEQVAINTLIANGTSNAARVGTSRHLLEQASVWRAFACA